MQQMKSYDEHVSGHKGFDGSKNSQNKNFKSKFLQNESFSSLSLKCLDLNCTPRKDTAISWIHRIASFVQL